MPRKDALLSAAVKADARAALVILKGSGLTLETAARLAVGEEGAASAVPTPLEVAVDAFMRRCLKADLRERTVTFYDDALRSFAGSFPDQTLDDFSRAGLKNWFEAMSGQPATVLAAFRAVRALFRFAARQEPPMLRRDPTLGLKLELGGRRESAIAFLSVAESAAIMEKAGPYRAALGLMLFAGIRPEEVAGRRKPRLPWSAVDPVDRIIRIPAAVSKTRRARILENLPAALWAFLGQPGEAAAPISPGLCRQATERAKAAAGYGRQRKWPQDVLRHTFASYHVALEADPGKTALLLGHEGSPTLLYNHYRGLATQAEARRFFALRPTLKILGRRARGAA